MKRLLTFMLVICMVFMAVGCSGGTALESDDLEENDTPVDKPEDDSIEEVDEDITFQAFYEIKEIQDMVLNFKELRYSFSDAESVLTVDYKYVAQETVEGVNADHFSVSFAQGNESSDIEIWMDNSGNFLKASFDGESLGPAEAPMASMVLMVVLVPFSISGEEWEDAFLVNDGNEQLGWVVSSTARENRDFGTGSVTVHQYSYKVAVDGQNLDYRFEVAELNGGSMFVGWEVDLDTENAMTFKVDKLIPR